MLPMLLAVVLLGLVNGSRTMMPMAVLCWFAYTGHLHVEGTWAFWTARLPTAIVFTVLAAGELIGDKLPKTPNRTAIFPLLARVAFGGLVGTNLCMGPGRNGDLKTALAICGSAAGLSALLGTFAGFQLRRTLTHRFKLPDLPVALVEDGIVIAVSVVVIAVVTRAASY